MVTLSVVMGMFVMLLAIVLLTFFRRNTASWIFMGITGFCFALVMMEELQPRLYFMVAGLAFMAIVSTEVIEDAT